jgi:hypothetical protein
MTASTCFLPFSPLRAVAFANKDVGIMAGGISGNALVARTSDGGKHWTSQVFFGCSFREACFLNGTTAWIGGASNVSPFIATSTDGGSTWVKKDGGLSASGVESFAMLNPMKGWAVSRRTVYKTLNGGITEVDGSTQNGSPSLFRLEQNYPNPFNPHSDIRYLISEIRNVRLSVYDVLGREVVVLVNEAKQPGVYTVRFDASGLSSGVYLYTMQAGSYTETKRLLLVR